MMKFSIFLWLLIFINELQANPANQHYSQHINYNNNRSSPIRPRKINTNVEQQTFVENFPEYPKNYIQSLDLKPFEHLFGDDFVDMLDLRFDADETGLCSSRTRIIYPKRGMTPQGNWLTIVNNDDNNLRQGIRVEECDNIHLGCQYTQNFPLSVESQCKQIYTYRNLVAININGQPIMEHFKTPSCCKCIVTVGHRSGADRNRNRFGDNGKTPVDEEPYILPY